MMGRACRCLAFVGIFVATAGNRAAEADEVPCPTASSPPAPVMYVGEPAPAPGGLALLGSFDIVINAGPALAANTAALAAFERAAAQWEAYIADPVTVTIDADLEALGPGPLGVTSNPILLVSYTTVRDALVADAFDEADDGVVAGLPTLGQLALLYPGGGYSFDGNVWMTKLNMAALGLSPSGPDPSIKLNSDFPFDYDNSDGVTPTQYDFESVAVHEIAHALGFMSTVDVIDTSPPGAYGLSPLDLFRF